MIAMEFLFYNKVNKNKTVNFGSAKCSALTISYYDRES